MEYVYIVSCCGLFASIILASNLQNKLSDMENRIKSVEAETRISSVYEISDQTVDNFTGDFIGGSSEDKKNSWSRFL